MKECRIGQNKSSKLSCPDSDLTEAQVGQNQFVVDVAVDHLDERINEVDGRADHASEYLSVLEGKVTDMEAGYTELLALGAEGVLPRG